MLDWIKKFFEGNKKPSEEDLVGVRKNLMREIAASIREQNFCWYLHSSDKENCVFRNMLKKIDLIYTREPFSLSARHEVGIGNPLDEVELPISGYEYIENVLKEMEKRGKVNKEKSEINNLDKTAYYLLQKLK